MYEQIKKDLSQAYYSENYPNDGQRFVAWYLRNIHNLDVLATKECITDGAGDKQIDAIYIDEANEIVYIIQGKFYAKETVDATPLREVLASWLQIRNLPMLQEAANEKLKVKIHDLSMALDNHYEVCFELITTSALTESVKHDLEIFKKELADCEEITASIVVVDQDVLKFRYDESLNRSRPYIDHEFVLEDGKYINLTINGAKAVVVALPLRECVKIPGIIDQSLFRKNVRQSLGNSNKVNKAIAHTLKKEPEDFFFLHNGITAICSKLEITGNALVTKELNVVNGCQSLTTIYNCSEAVKHADKAYIMFRFYEISDAEKADKISTCTNSQSAVKARDLRSNDKAVLAMKKSYQQYYTDGYFVTKRGETVDPIRYNTDHVIDLTDLGKQLIAWHSQRPTISYSETKIFDKYFDQIFYKDYSPENIQALNEMYKAVVAKWIPENPMCLNETLLAMKSYATFHHLYAISVFFCVLANMPEAVPDPAKVLARLKQADLLDTVIDICGTCLNMAFENASAEAVENNKIFSPQNWVKNKGSLRNIKDAVRMHKGALKYTTEGKTLLEKMEKELKLDVTDFESRWSAD